MEKDVNKHNLGTTRPTEDGYFLAKQNQVQDNRLCNQCRKSHIGKLYTVGMTHDIIAGLLNPHVYQTNYQVQSPNNYRTKTTAV